MKAKLSFIALIPAVLALTLAASPVFAEDGVRFNRDIRQILSNNCFECHGPDPGARKANLRLDTAPDATAERDGGGRAIAPGAWAESLLSHRVLSGDPNEKMPPPESGKALTDSEIALLKQWIDEGADYEVHWAYARPQRPELPEVSNPAWVRNPIDAFVMARLDKEGLSPSSQADPNTLVRRLFLDLTGLPPTPLDVSDYTNDPSPFAYEKLVNRLLASPQYGERWAQMWLDLARYADSKGYEKDDKRTIWRYRDWVIDAFNRDLPFDEFTIEQLAGDMLPHATEDQVLATAFHRNTMTNDEGGTDDEEFRTAAVVDRVNTTMEVWMGTTMRCAQCHTHKYDPITQTEYFRFYAMLNQTADADTYPEESPLLATPTKMQRRGEERLTQETETARAALQAAVDRAGGLAAWVEQQATRGNQLPASSTWYAAGPFVEESAGVAYDTNHVLPALFDAPGATPVVWNEHAEWKDNEVIGLSTDVAATYLYRAIDSPVAQTRTLFFGSNDNIKVWLNGELVIANRVGRKAAPDQETFAANLRAGVNHLVMKIVNLGGEAGFFFRIDGQDLALAVREVLETPANARTSEQLALLRNHYRDNAPEFTAEREELARAEGALEALRKEIPRTPVMAELPKDQERETRIQIRGSFMNLGDPVEPGVPEIFNDLPEGSEPDRLAMARWLVSEENPLTARVTVNRFWEQFFGRGIVATLEDFGTQGALPSHLELLDWLATEFMARNWSMKDLCRTIVTSATYRQDSRVTPAAYERDRYNVLLARGPRFRLAAEFVRDEALAVAGLLSDRMYGPSVMPFQPEGLWQITYNNYQWATSEGEDQYRRGLYTFWRRSSPYPSMVAFDAPSREVCTTERSRTNTPLQALVTMNDPVFVEAAQGLARRIVRECDGDVTARVGWALQTALARPATAEEAERLATLYDEVLADYRNDTEDAATLATEPRGPAAGENSVELAAWTVVSNVILNLDEFLVKR